MEGGRAEFPWSFFLKAGEGSDGEFAGIGGTAHPLEEVSEYTVILVPLRAAPPRTEVFSPSACMQLFGA